MWFRRTTLMTTNQWSDHTATSLWSPALPTSSITIATSSSLSTSSWSKSCSSGVLHKVSGKHCLGFWWTSITQTNYFPPTPDLTSTSNTNAKTNTITNTKTQKRGWTKYWYTTNCKFNRLTSFGLLLSDRWPEDWSCLRPVLPVPTRPGTLLNFSLLQKLEAIGWKVG